MPGEIQAQAASDANKSASKKVVSPKEPVEPLKFKPTGELKGPVTRIKLDPSERPKSSKSSRKSPFRDRGLLDDTDSLLQMRNSIGKPIVYTLLAIGLVYLIFIFSRPTDETAKMEKELRPLLTQADQMLADVGSIDSDELKKRIEFADQLSEFKDSQEALDHSSELKLRSLTTLDALNIEKQITDEDIKNLMEANSREFINSRNKTVSNLSKVGLMLIRVHGYLDAPNEKFFPELLDQFKLISNFAREDLPTARNLFRVANAFEARQLADESSQLFRSINLACAASPNQDITAVATEARGKLSTTTSTLFDDLKKMISTGEKIKIDQVQTKIKENLTEETISASAVEAVLDFLDLLVQKNAVNAVNILMPDVSSSIYNLPLGFERDTVKQRLDNSTKRMEQIGKTFTFNGLFSVEGRPISRTSFAKRPKLVVFWSPENSKSMDLLNRLSDKTKEFLARKVKIIAISTVEDSRADRERVLDIANKIQGIEFYTLIKERTQSQAFASRFPVPKLPYWILLSEEDETLALNTPPGIVVVDDLY